MPRTGEHHRLAGGQQLVVHLHVRQREAHALVGCAQPVVCVHLQPQKVKTSLHNRPKVQHTAFKTELPDGAMGGTTSTQIN